MKKFFENKYIDHALKLLISLILGWFIYIMVDIRDFMKYKQPIIDEKQSENIKAMDNRCNIMYETIEYKNANVNQRIDKHADKFNQVDRKLDLILYKLDIFNKNDLLTKNK